MIKEIPKKTYFEGATEKEIQEWADFNWENY